jgi:hypothetical protein
MVLTNFLDQFADEIFCRPNCHCSEGGGVFCDAGAIPAKRLPSASAAQIYGKYIWKII